MAKLIIENTEHLQLAKDIDAFLASHGKRDASDPKEWNGPDPAELERVSKQLKSGHSISSIHPPFSEFGSGCYKNYHSNESRKLHDNLISRFHELKRKT